MEENKQIETSYQKFKDNNQILIQLQVKSFLEEQCQRFFFFYNTGSGSKVGDKLNPLDCKDIQLTIEDKNQKQIDIIVHFASLQNKLSREWSLEQLKKIIENGGENIRIVAAGGDGTTMWVIECLINFKIDVMRCILIPLPLGTGNDFSNSLGWGVDPPKNLVEQNYSGLKKLLSNWQNGTVVLFDIWDITLKTKHNGKFQKIVQVGKDYVKQTIKSNDELNMIEFHRKMSNYISIGVDARIGLGFDRNRTNSKYCNKCVYCWEGFKKMFIKTKQMDEVIQGFSPIPMRIPKKSFADIESVQSKNDQSQQQTTTVPQIEGTAASLLALNINSYSGGVQDIWEKAQPVPGCNYHTKKASSSDGLLEFMTFPSIFKIANERFWGGNAQRLAQEKGPFSIKFRDSLEELITYFQVDGEYYSVINPDILEIKQCEQLPDGKIQVLIRNK